MKCSNFNLKINKIFRNFNKITKILSNDLWKFYNFENSRFSESFVSRKSCNRRSLAKWSMIDGCFAVDRWHDRYAGPRTVCTKKRRAYIPILINYMWVTCLIFFSLSVSNLNSLSLTARNAGRNSRSCRPIFAPKFEFRCFFGAEDRILSELIGWKSACLDQCFSKMDIVCVFR